MTKLRSGASMEGAVSAEIIQVVEVTFKTMFGVLPKASGSEVFEHCAIRADISGVIPLDELKQNEMNGTLVLSFPEETIYALLEAFYQKPFGNLDPSVQSSVGELTNVLYTTMKKNLNESGTALRSAIPVVIVGSHQHQKLCSFDCTTVANEFSTPVGNFTVYANILRKTDKRVG